MIRFTILSLLIISTFYSCEEAASEGNIDQEAIITTGKWNILFFFDENGDKAKPYANYSFAFIKDGTVEAVKDTNLTTGSWLIGEVSNDSQRMVLNFTDDTFSPLGQEWILKEVTSDKIELIRFDTGGSENLVFIR